MNVLLVSLKDELHLKWNICCSWLDVSYIRQFPIDPDTTTTVNGPLSWTTRVSQWQKKHSPA